MDVSSKVIGYLGGRSSRRTFFRVLGGSALGTGVMLTGSGVALADVSTICFGCGGGTVCSSPAPPCSNCPDGCGGGGCPSGWTLKGSWTVCGSNGCKIRCIECCRNGSGCHCFTPLPTRCRPNVVCPC